MLKRFTLLSFPVLCLLLFSCKGSEDEKEPQPTVTYLGEIELYDEAGRREEDYSGVEVAVLGTEPLVRGYTDARGKFEVEGVPIGRRRASFSKPGYGTYITIEYNYRIAEDGTTGNRFVSGHKIGKVSTTVPSEVTASVEGNRIAISGKVSPAASMEQPRQRQVFLSKDPNVSKDNYMAAVGTMNSVSGTFKDRVDIEYLKTKGFASGDKVYLVVHGNTVAAHPYKDPETGKTVFPALNPTPSNVTSIVIP